MPAQLPAGSRSLPPLGGRLFLAYRLTWWLLIVLAIAALGVSWSDPSVSAAIWSLRLVKSLVLAAVAALLFRRRSRDPVAAMLSLAFLLWIVSSSIDFMAADQLAAILDRLRFLFFAMALLLFPDAQWQSPWPPRLAMPIVVTAVIGIIEASGLIGTHLYLPIAVACVLATLALLLSKYRVVPAGTQKQQLKWVMLGLFVGIALILAARALSSLTAGMAMPLLGAVAIEGLFQLGIIVLALGFLTSLLRYRLYDAEAAISRSAIYAALTLSLVGTFAACEALIELLGQRFFGSSFGSVSGAVAAAIAAVLLTPLHSRISGWVEQYFQRDLAILKQELPDLLEALSAGNSLRRVGAEVLPRVEAAVQSTHSVLIVAKRLIAAQGLSAASARRLLKDWREAGATNVINHCPGSPFALQLPLYWPSGRVGGWLMLGSRPDGSFYGKDDLDALAEIARPLQRTLFQVSERERAETIRVRNSRAFARALGDLRTRIETLEARA